MDREQGRGLSEKVKGPLRINTVQLSRDGHQKEDARGSFLEAQEGPRGLWRRAFPWSVRRSQISGSGSEQEVDTVSVDSHMEKAWLKRRREIGGSWKPSLAVPRHEWDLGRAWTPTHGS